MDTKKIKTSGGYLIISLTPYWQRQETYLQEIIMNNSVNKLHSYNLIKELSELEDLNEKEETTLGTTIAYGMPGLGAGYMYLLMSLYVMKFSTDVLLIAPAVVGIIFSISRIWDAVSDPIAGYLSDRTTFKFGRRRTWMLISFIQFRLDFLAVFSPPESVGQSLDLWMMIAILSFYSAITLLNVPHMAHRGRTVRRLS